MESNFAYIVTLSLYPHWTGNRIRTLPLLHKTVLTVTVSENGRKNRYAISTQEHRVFFDKESAEAHARIVLNKHIQRTEEEVDRLKKELAGLGETH